EALIVATPNPDHRRSPRFLLSESGRNTLVTINSAAADWHRMVLEEFDLEELEQLADSLQRLTRVARRWPRQGRGGQEAEQLRPNGSPPANSPPPLQRGPRRNAAEGGRRTQAVRVPLADGRQTHGQPISATADC